MTNEFSISNTSLMSLRPLVAADSQAYRALRKKILGTKDACYFSDSYEREGQLTEAQWLEWCAETHAHCILGTFADSELVGIIMITRQGGTDSPVVEWEAAWLDPLYRATGYGKRAYELAKKWSQEQGYKFVVGFIRATYTPALYICQKLGFVYAYTVENELWADGTVGNTHALLLDLKEQTSADISESISDHFQEAFLFLRQGVHAPPQQILSAILKTA
jgi:GNAT superfamily N-acetyltransferase